MRYGRQVRSAPTAAIAGFATDRDQIGRSRRGFCAIPCRVSETRKIAAILVADVVGYSRLTAADEERTLARLRALWSDLIDPTIAVHHGRIVKRTGDGAIVEFRSVIDAVRCALEVQDDMVERNAGLPPERRIEFRVGIHLGDIVEESDGDLMGDGVNIAARLEGICEVGGICISEDAYRQVRDKIKESFVDLGEQALKNIARPVRAYQVRPARDGREVSGEASAAELVLPDRPSIAVLPFDNMSGDPEQDYFADGIVEDITTGLSRIKWLFVIARNSSSVYKGNAVDVRKVGRELGVRYVLEGGVRKAGQRLRITAQLVDATTGAHVWADRFDGAFEDVFDLQDQITDRVVAAVEPNVQKSEIERSRQKRPDNLDAYDLYLRARPYTASQSAEEGKIAIGFLEEALRIDPDYAAAHALIAWCYEWCYSRAGFDESNKTAALSHARAAIKGKTDDANALAIAGFVIVMLDKDQAGLNAIDRALAINPSCATALFVGSAANAMMGRSVPALSYANRALRLSPFDLLVSVAHTAQGIASLQEGRAAEAAVYLDHSVEANPTLSSFRFFAACAHALAGELDTAISRANEGLAMEPDFRLRFFFELLPRELAEKFAEGGRSLSLRD
jgi:TolB-like protein